MGAVFARRALPASVDRALDAWSLYFIGVGFVTNIYLDFVCGKLNA